VGGLGSIEGLEFQSLRFVFSSDGEEGVEDAFEGLREARPDAGKGLAMNRRFTDQVANRVGAEIDIAESRIAAHGQRPEHAALSGADGAQSRPTNVRQCPGFSDDTCHASMWITGHWSFSGAGF
jgi:hypothetical protein